MGDRRVEVPLREALPVVVHLKAVVWRVVLLQVVWLSIQKSKHYCLGMIWDQGWKVVLEALGSGLWDSPLPLLHLRNPHRHRLEGQCIRRVRLDHL